MGASSKIEWTDASWNPIRAQNLANGKIGWYCEHSTTGCELCYAEGMNKRLGTGLPFKPGHRKDIEIFLDEKMLLAPLRWRKPRMIFVCSMTDAFADFVTDEWLDRMFAVMALCPQHTFQVLTKRAERMREYFAAPHPAPNVSMWQVRVCETIDAMVPERHDASRAARHAVTNAVPLRNIWLGVSCERQQEADERIPHLLQTPASVRFISAEPLLGPIDLIGTLARFQDSPAKRLCAVDLGRQLIDWVIVGGESGKSARPFHLEWGDSLVNQCGAAGIACFVKQFGSCPLSAGHPLHLKSSKGGDCTEWPERLRVRQFPQIAFEARAA